MKCATLLVTCALTVTPLLTCTADDKYGDKKTQPRTVTVTMKSLSFEPKKLEIRVGDSVVWNNKAFAAHSATSDYDGKTFDTGNVEPGTSSNPVKFNKAGEFKYHCLVHGKTMSGNIVVKAAEK
jgi:plastocyanin